MKKLKVIIADNDKDYSQRLFLALERKYNNLDLTLADGDRFVSLLQNRSYDIALFDFSAYSVNINLKNAKLAIALLDDDTEESVKLANAVGKYIIKYQNVEVIYKEMIGYFSEISNGQLLNSGNTSCQMICFYSPAGGTGKTVVSCAAAEMIANRGNRVLYLNFENIASYGPIFEAKAGKGLDEIIYQLDKDINMPMKIRSLVKKSRSGVMFFDMFSNIMDVTEITNEKMSALIDAITVSDICDYIIADMDTSLKGINSVLLDKSDKIIIVETPDAMCREKITQFYMQKSMFEEYFSKASTVRNKANDIGGVSVTGLEVISTIPRINNDSHEYVISEIVRKAKLNIDRLLS